MTGPQDYRRALDRAVAEYEALTAERARLDARIGQLAQTIGTLTRLCGMVPTVPWGLTDACRMVLKSAGHPLSALEVRAQLEAMGFELSRYTSDLAAIHTVLKRLNDAGEARFIARAWDKPAYQWASPPATLDGGRARAVARPARNTPKTTRRRT